MRSLASLYFFVIVISYILWSIESEYFMIAVLFGGCSLFVANVQPHKKKYMSVIDSLIFANSALLSIMLDRSLYASTFLRVVMRTSILIPMLGLFSFIAYRLLKKQLKIVMGRIEQKLLQTKAQLLVICCNGRKNDARDEEQGNTARNDHDEGQLPDRIVHPELYTQEFEDQAA